MSNGSKAMTIIKHDKVEGRSVMKAMLVRFIDEFEQWDGNDGVKEIEDIGKLTSRWNEIY